MITNIAQQYISRIDQAAAAAALEALSAQMDEKDVRSGGVLSVIVEGITVESSAVAVSIGTFPREKVLRYAFNAHEKPRRVSARMNSNPGLNIATASESAAHEIGQYGGSVVFMSPDGAFRVFLNFSGAQPQADEAFCYGLGVRLGLRPPMISIAMMQSALTIIDLHKVVLPLAA